MISMDTHECALHIVQKLVRAGHIAYYAGGWVRDYLMGHPSSDIDIATNASPEKILDIFPNSIKVGLAFGVVVVSLHGKLFEVATFRKDFGYENGRSPLRIEPATPQEDAQRRDFTINGMFYDPIEDQIFDYVHGAEDIQNQVIRTIGNPQERFAEDRLRLIRAIRFSAKLGFRIDLETQEAIAEYSDSLFPAVSMERIWKELTVMSKNPRFESAILDMHRLGILEAIFPELHHIHHDEIKKRTFSFGHFPPQAPAIAYLLELFPEKSAEEAASLCKYLKATNQDIHFSRLLIEAKGLVSTAEVVEDYTWSHFYAHKEAQLCLEIIAAGLSEENRSEFHYIHQQRRKRLANFIKRIQDKKPVISAGELQSQGISPGKIMGSLLKEAERLSINRNLEDPHLVISLLKESSLWPSL